MPAPLPMPTPRYSGPGGRGSMRERVGLYLLGAAIGCVLVASLILARQNAMRARQTQQPGAPQQPAPPLR